MSEEIVKKSEEIVKESAEESVRESENSTITESETAESETAESETAESETAESETAETGIVKTDGVSADEKTMGMLAHLLGIFTTFVGPLVIWLTQKDSSSFAAEEAKEALNFQISLMIYYAVLTVATMVLTVVTLGLFGVVAPFIFPALGVFALVVMIMGTLQAKEGNPYRYPLCIRFIK